MPRGGARQGAGRKKGVTDRLPKAATKRVALAAFKGDSPLEFLLKVMRDPKQAEEVRIDAAKAALGFVHPRLSNIEHKGDPENPIETVTQIVLVAGNGNRPS